MEQRACGVGEGERHVLVEGALEQIDPALPVLVLQCLDLGEEIWVARNAPCAKVMSVRVRMLAPSTVMPTGTI